MIQRSAETLIQEALTDTPVVLVMGPRQAGKSTLVMQVSKQHLGGNYITLDDPIALAQATENPLAFLIGRKPPIALDEIQRAPGLFLAMKKLVDQDRKPGQFLLSGSANVLVMPKVADSLAGRMEPIDLYPFSQAELENASSSFIDDLFSGATFAASNNEDLSERIVRGGFPEVVSRKTDSRREAWFQSYVRTVLDRDVRDLANISGLTQMPRLLGLLASRSSQPLNIASLAVETGIAHTTLTRYIDLLKALFLITLVPAWSMDGAPKLTKTSKAYILDSGLMAYLNGSSAATLADDWLRFPAAVETFVAGELVRLIQASKARPSLFHLRTVKQKEVDFVLENRRGEIVGIEVRAKPALTPDDLEGLLFLKELAGTRFTRGIVLYQGPPESLGEGIEALPISSLWAQFTSDQSN